MLLHATSTGPWAVLPRDRGQAATQNEQDPVKSESPGVAGSREPEQEEALSGPRTPGSRVPTLPPGLWLVLGSKQTRGGEPSPEPRGASSTASRKPRVSCRGRVHQATQRVQAGLVAGRRAPSRSHWPWALSCWSWKGLVLVPRLIDFPREVREATARRASGTRTFQLLRHPRHDPLHPRRDPRHLEATGKRAICWGALRQAPASEPSPEPQPGPRVCPSASPGARGR